MSDIDIEEHDVLDNPAIKEIFPDMSVLKQELNNSFDQDDEAIISELTFKQSNDDKDQKHLDECSAGKICPTYQKEIKKEPGVIEHPYHRNKIILGSKPHRKLDYEDFFEKKVKLKGGYVQLEDLGPYLDSSDRYCGRCLILFPFRSDFEDHKNSVHQQFPDSSPNESNSHLLEIIGYEPIFVTPSASKQTEMKVLNKVTKYQMNDDHSKRKTSFSFKSRTYPCKLCNRVFYYSSNLSRHRQKVKCTETKENLSENISQKMKPMEKSNEEVKHIGDTGKICSHCNCQFPNQATLIDHMYSILDSQNMSNAARVKSTSATMTTSMNNIKRNYRSPVNTTSQTSQKTLKNRTKSPSQGKMKPGVHVKNRASSKISHKTSQVTKSLLNNSKPKNIFFYECPVCYLYFHTVNLCAKHLEKYHNAKITTEKIKQVSFRKRCRLCLGSFKTRKSYNKHIYRHHRKLLHANGIPLLRKTKLNKNKKNTSIDEEVRPSLPTHSEGLILNKSKLNMSRQEHAENASFETLVRKYPEVLIEDKHLNQRSVGAQRLTEAVRVHSPLQKLTKDDHAEDVALNSSKGSNSSFILKSTLFKCNRCDIHFISAKTAVNHIEHMELLVNWKCSTCHRIFKKVDQESHEKQHIISNDLKVHDFHLYGMSVLSKVLFKCVKCAVHFNDEKFPNHFNICEKKKPDSVYCKWCDILIDKTISKVHELCHVQDSMKLEDLIIIEADILTDICNDLLPSKKTLGIKRSTISDYSNDRRISQEKLQKKIKTDTDTRKGRMLCQESPGTEKEMDIDTSNDRLPNKVMLGTKRYTDTSNDRVSNKEKLRTKRKADTFNSNDRLTSKEKLGKKLKIDTDTSNDIFPSKVSLGTKTEKKSDIPKLLSLLLNLCYCDTCHCYIVECHKRDVHIESRCSHMLKYVCKYCGLVLTAKSYQTHKNLHSTLKDLKLHDFNFTDMRSGKKICPPIPQYPKCENCEVHFGSKAESRSHECSTDVYLTCQICDIKLSEEAFKLHMPFHKLHNSSLHEIENADAECFTVDNSSLDFETIKENWNSTKELFSNTTNMDTLKNSAYNKKIESNKDQNEKIVATKCTDMNDKETRDSVLGNETIIKSDMDDRSGKKTESEEFNSDTNSKYIINGSVKNEETEPIEMSTDFVLFFCKTCKIAVDTYDKVVKHCHWHYSHQENDISTIKCNLCDITFEKSSYTDHEKCYSGQHHKNMFRLFYFDTCYFRCRNDVWIKHLLGSLPKEEIDKIIGKTIYKFECRVKMVIIQHGEPDLTVYKCDKCQCFIDGKSLYRHAENSCFKLRKHPCSFCGLPFMASLTRMEHEKIHETRDITQQCYRIVIFNRDEDKDFNNRLNSQKKYVLHQCRNCDVVISDKCLIESHTCYKQDLEKCLKCGLLFDKSDYESHALKYEDLPDFKVDNMKVVLTGVKVNKSNSGDSCVRTQFKGVMKDYTFYSCTRCQTCFQTLRMVSEHICCFGINRSKCPDCDLYFYSSKIKFHRKLHEIDADFIKQHMQIIPTDPHHTKSKSNDSAKSPIKMALRKTTDHNKNESAKTENNSPSTSCLVKLNDRTKVIQNPLNVISTDLMTPQEPNDKNVSKVNPSSNHQIHTEDLNTVVEQVASIHKCYCGLHFLDKRSILSHMKVCNLRIRATRQTCSKCSLKFTPNILYSHLLLHHGNKNVVYKFDVIEPTDIVDDPEDNSHIASRNNSNVRDNDRTIYKCKECSIHYLTEKSVLLHVTNKNEHFNKHQDICNICGLNFVSATLAHHIHIHHRKIRVLHPNDFIIKEY